MPRPPTEGEDDTASPPSQPLPLAPVGQPAQSPAEILGVTQQRMDRLFANVTGVPRPEDYAFAKAEIAKMSAEVRKAAQDGAAEYRRLRTLHYKGKLPTTVSHGDCRVMLAAYLAAGGAITRCPEGRALGVSDSPFWGYYYRSLAKAQTFIAKLRQADDGDPTYYNDLADISDEIQRAYGALGGDEEAIDNALRVMIRVHKPAEDEGW